jgi:ParB family chromosome partitioning protein
MMLDGHLTAGVPVLVAGAHRLAAAKALGWSHINCIEVDDDALRAELWEIDENLMRSELSPAQQADHLARRKVIWEGLNSGKNFPTKGRPKGFAGATATATGVSKSAVNLQVARATALGPDIRAVVGTSLDKGRRLNFCYPYQVVRLSLAARPYRVIQVNHDEQSPPPPPRIASAFSAGRSGGHYRP